MLQVNAAAVISPADRFCTVLENSIRLHQFSRLLLTKYLGSEPLQRIEITPVEIRQQIQLRFVYCYQTNHQTKNMAFTEGMQLITQLLGTQFKHAHLETLLEKCHLSFSKKGKPLFSSQTLPPGKVQTETHSHNRQKHRFIEQSRPFLQALGVTDSNGVVIPKMSDKWKQINKFIEVLAAAVKETGLTERQVLHVADFGSGKAYLTFAMHDYFCQTLGLNASITGVELRPTLVDLCNDVAAKLQFTQLQFEQGDVQHFKARGINVMVALHACDTATDHAIHMGIRTGAEIIMCSPCCHKELRPQLQLPQILAPMLVHGIHLGQQAEMLTDSLRALFLEAHGYQTKVFEFISLEHTSKNKMILATKRRHPKDPQGVLAQIAQLKQFYGVKQHTLERLLQQSVDAL